MFVDFFVRRPVFSSVCSIILVVFGAIGYGRLPVQEFPNIDPPVVTVVTTYLGASPAVVETEVTEVLEEEINGIEGIETLTSTSSQSTSSITVQFTLERNIDLAAQDVRDRVSRAVGRLPREVEAPIVSKEQGDAAPIIWFALSGGGIHSSLDLTDYAERNLVDALETVSGVSRIFVGGERRYAMRLWLDPKKLAARQLTVLDVEAALANQNVEIPGGVLEGPVNEYAVRVLGRLQNPEDYGDLILAGRADGTQVRLRDVGRAEVGAENERTFARFKGEPAIALGVVKLAKSNTLEVAAQAKARMADLADGFPAGMSYSIAFDSSEFVAVAIEEVWGSLAIAIALTILSIFLFLHNWRATFIPAITIPISLAATFGVMYFLNLSINTLTLFALTLATGLVVDDTIVVLENVTRYIHEKKLDPFTATQQATQEVIFAVIATTLVLVAVFVPVVFATGTAGRLFSEFALTLAGAVVISTFVALTLAPTLCARLLRASDDEPLSRWNPFFYFERGFSVTRAAYGGLLQQVLRLRGLVPIGFVLALGLAYLCFSALPRELIPTEDRGVVLSFVNGPEGTSLPYTDRAVAQVEQILAKNPNVESYFALGAFSTGAGVGETNRGIAFAKLKPWADRPNPEQSQMAIVGQLFGAYSQIAEALAFPINLPGLPGAGFDPPVQLVLQGRDLAEIDRLSADLVQQAQGLPQLVNVDRSLKIAKPELQVTVNRDQAAALGVSVEEIARTLQILMGGQELSSFNREGRRYEVVVQADAPFRANPRDLEEVYVPSRSGEPVLLADLVTLSTVASPAAIERFSRLRSSTLSASPAPGYSLGDALTALQTLVDAALPPGLSTALKGESREFAAAGQATVTTFGLSAIFIFLVLAAQFESYLDPFIVMLAVPLSLLGAFGGLLLLGQTLNAYSQVGLIVLIGLVTKNSILLVEFANQLRDHGMPPVKAAIESARIRFRPILMTALSTLFGTLPLAFASGPGAASRAALGTAVLGGMAVSTVLSLGVVPAFYAIVNLARHRRRDRTP
ncbi:MAG: efflux RND transporter permease subunit [Cyanophyceae cyanobacterium]